MFIECWIELKKRTTRFARGKENKEWHDVIVIFDISIIRVKKKKKRNTRFARGKENEEWCDVIVIFDFRRFRASRGCEAHLLHEVRKSALPRSSSLAD